MIAWNDCQDASGNTLKFEIILYETTNVIEFQYHTLNFARTHMPGINKGDGVNGYKINDAGIGSGYALKFTPW